MRSGSPHLLPVPGWSQSWAYSVFWPASPVAERWAAAREARDAALQAINAELRANAELLRRPAFGEDPNQPLRRTVYPRLHLSAVDAALAGGSVSSARDVTLVRGLHAWRNQDQ